LISAVFVKVSLTGRTGGAPVKLALLVTAGLLVFVFAIRTLRASDELSHAGMRQPTLATDVGLIPN
jgi:hypothetical protein